MSNEWEESKKKEDLEFSKNYMKKVIPEIWYSMFVNLQKEGFTKEQAFELIKIYVGALKI